MKLWMRVLMGMSMTLSAVAWSQDAAPAATQGTEQQPFTLQAGTKIVLAPTTVELNKKFVYGLTADQFQIEDNGVRVKPTLDDQADVLGMSLVVLLQCSRSAVMQYENLAQLPSMIEGLVGAAPREVALVRYGAHPELVQPFTRSLDEMNAGMQRMGPCEDDKAATVDAVSYGASILANRRDKFRHVILLISETRDHGSTVKESHVIEQLGKTNTVVNAVSFSPMRTDLTGALSYKQAMSPFELLFAAVQAVRQNAPKALARLSGGVYTNFATQKGFESALGELSNRVHNYYLLSFTVPPGAADGMHQVTVTVPEYPKAVIRSRESYYAGETKAPDVPPDASPESSPKVK